MMVTVKDIGPTPLPKYCSFYQLNNQQLTVNTSDVLFQFNICNYLSTMFLINISSFEFHET